MREVFVRASKGIVVRDPCTGRPLSEEGEFKPATPFWQRQIREGAALVGTPPKTAVSSGLDGLSVAPDEADMTGLDEPKGGVL